MAGSEAPGFFAFTNRPMPAQPEGAYQTVGLLLRVLGWIVLAYGILIVTGFVFAVFALFFLAALFDSLFGSWHLFEGLAGAVAVMAVVVMVVAFVAALMVAGAVLWWISLAYERWRTRHPSALTHVLVLGIVATAYGAVSLLGGLATGDPFQNVGGIVGLGFGVALLVLQNRPDMRRAFVAPGGSVAAAAGWQEV